MANPTTQVAAAVSGFDDLKFYWPLIGGATNAKTYQPNQMMGLRSDGYATDFDDTANLRFLGLLANTVPLQVDSGDANGAKLALIWRPRRIEIPFQTGTGSKATNIGQPVLAYDAGVVTLSATTYMNRVGTLVDVKGTNMPTALTGALAVVEPLPFSSLYGTSEGELQIAAADGAINIKSGTVVITKAGVCALTLADPTATVDDFKILEIRSVTANAHTVSNAAGSGFNGGGSGADVGTFGAAKGNGFRLLAYQGDWYVISNTNVTLG